MLDFCRVEVHFPQKNGEPNTEQLGLLLVGEISMGTLFGSLFLAMFAALTLDPFVDGSGSVLDWEDKLKYFAIACVSSVLVGHVGWNFGVVDCRVEEIEVYRNGRRQDFDWHDVASISQMPFVTPPLYRIQFKTDEPAVYVIVFSWFVVSVGVWSWDFTGFKDYVELQIYGSEFFDRKHEPGSGGDQSTERHPAVQKAGRRHAKHTSPGR